jgi:TRAP-type C4-dicarboxylate transport system substrate-binding protein
MHDWKRKIPAQTALAATLLGLSLLAGEAQAQDKTQDKTYIMKITLPTINESQHLFAKNYAAAVERDSGGRIKAEIYPANQLGSIPRQIEGTQFNAIQCAVMPPEYLVGVDERFEVMAAPGLVDSLEQAERLTADPAVQKMLLGLGADKGLHGVGLYAIQPSSIVARAPIRHLSDLSGKKLRIIASPFQAAAFQRLGATTIAMSLGDVLPALQQGTIDAALNGMTVYTSMHYKDAAKFITEINQPTIFSIIELSKIWYDSLPKDLQQIVDADGAAEATAVKPSAVEMFEKARKDWTAAGGELINLPPDEQASMLKTLASVGDDVSNTKPQLSEAYKIVTAAAQRVH